MKSIVHRALGAPRSHVWSDEPPRSSKDLALWHFTSPVSYSSFDPSQHISLKQNTKCPRGQAETSSLQRAQVPGSSDFSGLPLLSGACGDQVCPFKSAFRSTCLWLSCQQNQYLLLVFFSLADKISIFRRIFGKSNGKWAVCPHCQQQTQTAQLR